MKWVFRLAGEHVMCYDAAVLDVHRTHYKLQTHDPEKIIYLGPDGIWRQLNNPIQRGRILAALAEWLDEQEKQGKGNDDAR